MKNYLFFLLIANVLCYVVADSELQQDHCQCIDYDCGCCTQLYVKKLMNGRLCSNFSYLPDEYGISLTITYKNLAIYNETISLKNPPHICILHVDEIKMEICLRFYNLDVKNKCFSGCAEFEVEFFKLVPFKKLELGCFGCKNNTFDMDETLNYYQAKHKVDNKKHPEVILV